MLSPLMACATTQVTERPQAPRTQVGAAGPVAVILSAAATQTLSDGRTRPTGYFLSEMYDAVVAVESLGLSIEFVTPGGRTAVIDPESEQDEYWPDRATLERARQRAAEIRPISAAQALERAAEFLAVVVVGGQGMMVDVVASVDVAALLVALADRPVGLICHAPALLTRLPTQPFAGRTVTSVSGVEEWFIESFIMGATARDRGIHEQLEASGFVYVSGWPGRAFAVRDGNLVTSQNPYSGPSFGALFRTALVEYLGVTPAGTR